MANKTLQFLGNGYGPTGTAAAVVVTFGEATFEGNTVFSGNIPTIYNAGEPLKAPDEMQPLFTVEIPEDSFGTFPMTVQVTAGDQVDLTQILSNRNNEAGNIDVFGVMGTGTDNRIDVVIDGVPQSLPDPRAEGGEWTWSIPAGSTMSCNIVVGNVYIPE
jgi:hypothetical protein